MISKDKKLIFLLTSIIILALAATDIYVSSLPEMTRYFHTTPNVINMTLGIFMIGLAIGTLFAGIFSERFGRRRVLLIVNIAFIVFTIFIVFTGSIIMVILLRFLQGICSAFFMIIARQITKDYFPIEEQITATATMNTGLILSPALAPIVGAYLSTYFDWRACFAAMVVLSFIIFVWIYFLLPETNLKRSTKLPNLKSFITSNLSLIVSRRFSGYVFVSSCGYGAYYSFIVISSYIYILHYNLSQKSYSYIYIVLAIAFLLGNSATKFFVKRKIKSKVIVLYSCYLAVIAALINLIFFINPHSTVLVVIVFSLAAALGRISIGIMGAPMQVLVMNDYSEKSAQAVGLLYFFAFVFEFIATIAVSAFHKNPMLGLIIVSAIFYLLTLPAWKLTMKARRKPHNFLPIFLKELE